MLYKDVISELTTQQCKELLVDTFGKENSKYHTLDEIRFDRLIAKIPKIQCACCGKPFIPNIEGGKKIGKKWIDLDCFWNNNTEFLKVE